MTAHRILLIDDDAVIREIAVFSLSLDSELSVLGCASGEEGLVAAVEYRPALILLDVKMPFMDGQTTLARLRGNPVSATIPVIFMTARAQTREIEQFKSLGAVGVIVKPFDPMTLVGSVRCLMNPIADKPTDSRVAFHERLNTNAEALLRCRTALSDQSSPQAVLGQVKEIAHGLAGAASLFGFPQIGEAAADLEGVATAALGGSIERYSVECSLDRLLACMRMHLERSAINLSHSRRL